MKKELNIQHSTLKTENSAFNTQNPPLPKGWVWERLGEICDVQTGKKDVNEGNPNGKYHFFTCAASPLRSDTYSFEGESIILPGNGANVGLVIYFNGKCELYQRTYILNNFKAYGKYVFYYMYGNWKKGLGKQFGSATNYIRLNNITDFKIPFPPLPEQQRIVSKIEELFTKLDAGVNALKKAKEQIKRYRQAVLKYAFEGKLTEEWREANRDKLESASVLLERIKEERKKNLGKKYRELPPIDTSELPELPEGWMRVRLGEIVEMLQYGTSEKATNESAGIPVLRMGNIRDGKIIFDDLKYFMKEWPHINEFILQDGDILFNRTNSAELVGKSAVYKKFHPPAVFASYLIRVRVNKNFYVSDLLAYFINSFFGREYIASVVSQQVGQANVNGTKLSLMSIPLPPLPEQQKIVEEIERRFSVADEVEKVIDNSLKQAERLRQSILKKAFEGKLVPQDPNDEPAEKLLERVIKEKLDSKNKKTKRR